MHPRHLRLFLILLLASTVVVTACAKRPALTQSSAPAPAGATGMTSSTTIVTETTTAFAPVPAPASPQGEASASQLSEAAPPRSDQPGAAARPEASTEGSASPSAAAPATTAPAPGPLALAPGQPQPSPRDFTASAELRDINFDFDRYNIRPGDARILDRNAEWLKANPETLVLIEGHCDERGTNEYNIALGERRARSTQAYLVGQGVASGRISIISYGEERPTCTEKTEECWAKNRRAHLLVKPR